MQQEVVTLVVAGLGIAGTLASGPLTQSFAKYSQRDQWRLDKKTEEFRELLDALTLVYLELLDAHIRRSNGIETEPDPAYYNVPTKAQLQAERILRNRLFIARELEAENVIQQWDDAMQVKDANLEDFYERFKFISATIVWLSTKKGDRPKLKQPIP
jgi:hypothetical protein